VVVKVGIASNLCLYRTEFSVDFLVGNWPEAADSATRESAHFHEGIAAVGAAPKPKTNIVPMRALSDKEALAWLVGRGRIETSTAALARDWRWSTSKVKSRLDRWSAAGEIDVKPGLGGRTVIVALSPATPVIELTASAVEVGPAGTAPAIVSVVTPAAVPPSADGEAAASAKEPAAAAPARNEGAAVVASASEPVSQPGDPLQASVITPHTPDESAPHQTAGAAPDAAAPSAPEPAARAEAASLPSRLGMRAPSVRAMPAARHLPTGHVPAGHVLAEPVFTRAALKAPLPHPRGSGFVSFLAYLVAVALAGIAAYFSITGMIVLFPGAPTAIVVMGVVMETAKLITVAFLAHQWRLLGWLSRLVLMTLVFGLASINAAGVYSQLVAAHFGDRSATSAVETEAAAVAAKSDLQAQTIADLDRRVAQIDGVIAEMTKRGRTSGALEAISTQRKQREALVGQRRHEAETLAALKTEAGAVAARTRQMEVEAAPIMYVAQMMGASTEQAIRMLILLMVLTCDPLAVALTAVASRPRRMA
jgi:hypothetical protein